MQRNIWNITQLVCEECCKPLVLYGSNTIESTVKYGKDQILTRFFCDLCYLEFQVAERTKAKFYAAQKRAKFEQLEVAI